MIDGILMLGFGGPTPGCCGRRTDCPRQNGCEAECFVSGILGDNAARERRVAEVVEHYRQLGGFSPYNALTAAQAEALRTELAMRGTVLRIACGYRHWTPWVGNALETLHQQGAREILALIMAPHQSSVSWDWYLKHAAEAQEALAARLGADAPRLVGVVQPWGTEPGYITAIADRIRAATAGWSAERFAAAELIFTAHAIPQPVAQTSPYCLQFAETSRLAAAAVGHASHVIGYQSAPDDSRIPWTGPTIGDLVMKAHASGVRDLVVQAAGFLVDHTEVLYDLDVEAMHLAERLGIRLTRAACVHDHPAYIGMLADRVQHALRR